MAETKTKPTTVPPSAFIDAISDPVRREDARALCKLLEGLSGERPMMWGPSIIGFGRYHYRYDSGHEGEAARIGFAPRGRETVLYLMGLDRQKPLLDRLGKHRIGRCCLYFKRLSDLDPVILRQLIVEDLAHMDRTYPRGA